LGLRKLAQVENRFNRRTAPSRVRVASWVLVGLGVLAIAAAAYPLYREAERAPALAQRHDAAVTVALPPLSTPLRAPERASPPAPDIAPPPARAGDQEPSDPAPLARWLQARATQGEALAQYRLGMLYALGKGGVEKDYARAEPLLRAAAESGLAEAQYDYAVLWEKGLGVPQDSGRAAMWLGKAAAQGNASAALSLGYAFAKGVGVQPSMADAAQWFRRAAESGMVDAQYNLAYLYEHGEGVTRSAVDAYAWYSIAAARGDDAAQQAAERVAKSLSPSRLKAAQSLVSELQGAIKGGR
jgi:TPR repeat protein